jgi:hypothetical protein
MSNHFMGVSAVSYSSLPNNDDPYHYSQAAKEGRIFYVQAEGMQPIRDYWRNPEYLGYDKYQAKMILAYRSGIKENIENYPPMGQEGNIIEDCTRTHHAHVKAAAATNTAPPSGSVMYHGGELLSGITNRMLGSGVAMLIFGRASELFNNPVGDSGKKNRDELSNTLEKYGKLLGQSVCRPAIKTLGIFVSLLGGAMRRTNSATEAQYNMLTRQSSGIIKNDSLQSVPSINSLSEPSIYIKHESDLSQSVLSSTDKNLYPLTAMARENVQFFLSDDDEEEEK